MNMMLTMSTTGDEVKRRSGLNEIMDESKRSMKADLVEVLTNTYILIVPSKEPKCFQEKAINPDKLIKMTSDEFLEAFRSLLVATVDLQSESSALSRQSLDCELNLPGSTKARSQETNTTEIPVPVEKYTCSVEQQTETESRSFCVVSTQTKETWPSIVCNKADKGVQAESIDKTAESTWNACSENHEVEYQITAQKLRSTDAERITPNGRCNLSSVCPDKQLKLTLLRLSPKLRKVALNQFLPRWATSKPLQELSNLSYLYSHVNLLGDFISECDYTCCSTKTLLLRYLSYLKKLIEQFCHKLKNSRKVIEFDQSVLARVCINGAWDFEEAWKRAEQEKKENSVPSQSVTPSAHADKQAFLPHKRLRHENEGLVGRKRNHTPYNTNTCNQMKYKQHVEFVNEQKVEKSTNRKNRVISCISNESKGGTHFERHVEFIPVNKENPTLTRKGQSPAFPRVSSIAKRRRHENSSVDNVSNSKGATALDAIKGKQHKGNPEKTAKHYCKYFNIGYCYKGDRCDFLHACENCSSVLHACLKCPKFFKK